MKNYLWSPKNNAFFPKLLLSDYINNGWDLSDAIEVDDDIYSTFTKITPEGKEIGCVDGMPCWVDMPPASHEDLVIQAEKEKSRLRAKADYEISWLEDAVNSDVATEYEKGMLSKWKLYRINVMRINTDSAPDISWPEF